MTLDHWHRPHEGDPILICDLEEEHLQNIIMRHERIASGSGWTSDRAERHLAVLPYYLAEARERGWVLCPTLEYHVERVRVAAEAARAADQAARAAWRRGIKTNLHFLGGRREPQSFKRDYEECVGFGSY